MCPRGAFVRRVGIKFHNYSYLIQNNFTSILYSQQKHSILLRLALHALLSMLVQKLSGPGPHGPGLTQP